MTGNSPKPDSTWPTGAIIATIVGSIVAILAVSAIIACYSEYNLFFILSLQGYRVGPVTTTKSVKIGKIIYNYDQMMKTRRK